MKISGVESVVSKSYVNLLNYVISFIIMSNVIRCRGRVAREALPPSAVDFAR